MGLAAARQIQGNGVEVFEDWKAGLFDARTAASSQEIAYRFFSGLKKALEDSRSLESVSKAPARICIPKLPNSDDVERALVGVLRKAGWTPCEKRPVVFEPESNILGLSSWGKNQTGPGLGGEPNAIAIRLQAMLEEGPLQAAFRRVQEGGYGVSVMDIGAFTTDFAYLHFDTGHESSDWTRPRVAQHSVPLGVRILTQSIIASLDPDIGNTLMALPGSERDACMRSLYHGEERRLVRLGRPTIHLGTPAHVAIVDNAICEFATRLWAERCEFQRANGSEALIPEYITGGGSLIPSLSAALEKKKVQESKRRHPDKKCHSTRELLDRSQPTRESEAEQHKRRAIELLRGGSAIGGCSVFFEFPNNRPRRLIHTKYGARYQ